MRKRGAETSLCGCLSCVPYWGPGLQPRHMSWLGIEPMTLWFTGQCSIHWATPTRAECTILYSTLFTYGCCVVTIQGQAGSWYSCTQKNIHRAVGMSGMLLFMGGQATHAANYVSICMSHVTALAPQRGTHHGTCSLVCLSSSSPQQGVPTCLSTRGERSRQDARTLHNTT